MSGGIMGGMGDPTNILFAFIVKHFICDYPLQATPWMYRSKGTYGHAGGIAHAAIHVLGSFLVLVWLTDTTLVVTLSALDGIVHYHIDWAKMNIGKRFNLLPTNSEWFWILLGLDQLLHYATYFAIVKVAA